MIFANEGGEEGGWSKGHEDGVARFLSMISLFFNFRFHLSVVYVFRPCIGNYSKLLDLCSDYDSTNVS